MLHLVDDPSKAYKPQKTDEPVGPGKLSESDFVLVIFPDILILNGLLIANFKHIKFFIRLSPFVLPGMLSNFGKNSHTI